METGLRYVRTEKDSIIIYSSVQSDLDFIDFKLKSAGYIEKIESEDGASLWRCSGKSVALGLSCKEDDTLLLNSQIFAGIVEPPEQNVNAANKNS